MIATIALRRHQQLAQNDTTMRWAHSRLCGGGHSLMLTAGALSLNMTAKNA
jgi:hypothetical protein